LIHAAAQLTTFGVILLVRKDKQEEGREEYIMKNILKKSEEVFSPASRFAENGMDAPLEAAEERNESLERGYAAAPHPEAGEIQRIKNAIQGHGEQTILPDECQYGDNDLCYVEV
jgi:hypothetical protein